MYDDLYEAGKNIHDYSGRPLHPDLQSRFDTSLRHVQILQHQTQINSECNTEQGSQLRAEIKTFESRFTNFTTHLRMSAEAGNELCQWNEQHAVNTLEVCRSVARMFGHLPSTLINSATTNNQSLTPPTIMQQQSQFTAAPPSSSRLIKNTDAGMLQIFIYAHFSLPL
jgi:hypothetical protein